MNVIIEAYLSEPPSSIHCFRDITLYTSCFIKADVLVECEKDMKDVYYKWLKSYGAYDFIDEIIEQGEELGYRIGSEKASLVVDKITADNINILTSRLDKIKKYLN